MEQTQIEHLLHTRFAKKLRNPFVQAVQQYQLIAPGDSIAVCISGGKDSALLALLLRDYQKHSGIPFTLTALAMDPGYDAVNRRQIVHNLAQLGLQVQMFETNVLQVAGNHAPENPCFLCAKMRRGYLYAEAQKRGCNKIALGHHYDDAIETVLMGLIYGGQIQAMLPRLQSANYQGMELIRPLYHVRERDVSEWVTATGLTFLPCACPAHTKEGNTKRAEIKALIAELAAENPQIEANLLNAVKNVDTAKVLGWRDADGRHSFLDRFV